MKKKEDIKRKNSLFAERKWKIKNKNIIIWKEKNEQLKKERKLVRKKEKIESK